MKAARFGNKGQMKIQQMAFMIVALFIFFSLVLLFFIQIRYSNLKKTVDEVKKQKVYSLLRNIANLPELSCKKGVDFCIDEYKARAWDKSYEEILGIDSLKIYKVYPKPKKLIKCPAPECNYYELIKGPEDINERAAYVSLCKVLREKRYTYERCEIAKLVVGVEDD